MNSKILSAIAIVGALSLAGCGDDGPEIAPNQNESNDAFALNKIIKTGCNGKGVTDVTTVTHEGYGRTSGFVALCKSKQIVAYGIDGQRAGKEETRDASSLKLGINAVCDDAGADRIMAVDHEGYGRTSGFLVRCVSDEQFKAVGR